MKRTRGEGTATRIALARTAPTHRFHIGRLKMPPSQRFAQPEGGHPTSSGQRAMARRKQARTARREAWSSAVLVWTCSSAGETRPSIGHKWDDPSARTLGGELT
eukprot:scaffold245673_cov32-Tisochrysis_lutea.AAC.2